MKSLIAVLVALTVLATPVLAVIPPTTVDTYWMGSGYMDTTFTSGDDAHSYFKTSGSGIIGEFHGKDYEDNPYGYNVDTASSSVHAYVAYGYMKFENTRDDSKTSMYGNPGQYSYSYIGTDGTGEMAWYSWTNYAEMANCEYAKPTTTNGKNFEVTGSNYLIDHELKDSSGDGAEVKAYSLGSGGSAQIKLQGEKSGGTNSYFNMGSLPVCGDGCAWKNNYATFTGSGTGGFEVHGWADNGLTIGCPTCGSGYTIPGDGSDNSAIYNLQVFYSGTWTMPDFGVAGN